MKILMSLIAVTAVWSEYQNPVIKKVLPNGLTVIVKTTPGTPVAGVHLLIGNRMLYEKKHGESILTQMLLTKGAGNYTREDISSMLEEIGARIKTVDNPYIPFDDYYNSRDFAYIRLRVLDENLLPSLKLLSILVREATFPPDELERAKKRLKMRLEESQNVPGDVASTGLYELLYAGTPLERPINGKLKDIDEISRADIIRYYREAYRPENCILAVVSGHDSKDVIAQIEELFGTWHGMRLKKKAPPLNPIKEHKRIVYLDSDRAVIYMGTRIPDITNEDIPALRVAAMVLSYRMSNVLREQRGLAYRLGAFTRFFKNYGGLFGIIMGTSSKDFVASKDGIKEMLISLTTNPPTQKEINRVLNARWGTFLRYHQKKINQAYYLSLYEYLGAGLEYDMGQIKDLRKVKPDDVVRVAKKYLDVKNFVLSAAGRIK